MHSPDRTNVRLVLVIWLAGLSAAAQFGKIAVLYDVLDTRYGGGIGLMVPVVGLVGLVFGATAGICVQQMGLRKVLVGALALGALVSALQSLDLAYWMMMTTRVLEGFSHLAIVVAGPVLIAQATAQRHLGAAMSLWSSFFGVSFAITASLGLMLANVFGPQTLFMVHAGSMTVLSLILANMVSVESPTPSVSLALGDLIQRHIKIYSSPQIAAPALGFVFYTCMYVALLTLLPTLFSGAERVLVATAMPLVSIAVSLALGVWLLSRWPAVVVVQIGFAVTALATVALWMTWGSGFAGLWALALSGGTGLVQGASFASIPQLNHSQQDRTMAAGAIAQLGNLGTTTGTPILAAMTANWAVGGVLLFALPLAIGGIATVGWLRARRRFA